MLHKFINALVNIVYPKKCLACKEKLKIHLQNELICAKCLKNIKKNTPPFCSSCGRHLVKTNFAKNICPSCLRGKLHFDRAFSPYTYKGSIKRLIHEFKYKGKDYLGSPLGAMMIDFINEYNLPINYIDFIIPVPLHKTKLREREFNQAQVLAEAIAKKFNKGLLTETLTRQRYTRAQADLEINERLKNVKGSFSITNPQVIKGKNLLVIDDVLTTGATSSEAAAALKEAGANIVFILTLAH
ncbi:MAG: ComF family protein [Candidatus Omnitrophota bacterium]|nr:ComF family protein [Candidatus Omnitrophota bacterium]